MSDDPVMISGDACRVITDAFERAIVDRGASSTTRNAAFAALLRLVDAGLVVDVGDTEPAPEPEPEPEPVDDTAPAAGAADAMPPPPTPEPAAPSIPSIPWKRIRRRGARDRSLQ